MCIRDRCVAEGGQTKAVGSYLHGAPELVVEVAISSAAYEDVYKRQGLDTINS